MTPENYMVIGGYFAAAAVFTWLHFQRHPRKKKQEVLPPAQNPVDVLVETVKRFAPDHELDMERVQEIRAYCNAPVAACETLGATRPTGNHQGASASAAAGGVVPTTPTSLESLRTAAAYICTHADQLDPVTRLSLLASVGGLPCVRAYYERGL